MGKLTLALDASTEEKLRALAEEKYHSKKGALARVVKDLVEELGSEVQRRAAYQKLLADMEKGFPMGKLLYKHRSELYDRP